jgi:predicted dinucleotide-utilizing enzyme
MFKQLIKYFFLFIIFSKSTVSFALPIPKKINLSDALEIAIQNYPSVKARMAEKTKLKLNILFVCVVHVCKVGTIKIKRNGKIIMAL